MKKFLMIFLFLPILNVQSQELDISPLQWDNENIIYQEVMEIEGVSKQEIFVGIKKHLINAYKNYDEVVQVENEDMGIFSGRAMTRVPYTTFVTHFWDVFYNFEIDVKDGKYRTTYKGMEVLTTGSTFPLEMFTKNNISGKYQKKLKGPAKDVIPTLGKYFENDVIGMKQAITQKDDW
jgi:hypothetical protein